GSNTGSPVGGHGAAAGHRAAAAGGGNGASFRSRSAVCVLRVRGVAASSRPGSEYEPTGKSLRQCGVRKLYEDPEAGGNLLQPVQRFQRAFGASGGVHRYLLQRAEAARGLGVWDAGGSCARRNGAGIRRYTGGGDDEILYSSHRGEIAARSRRFAERRGDMTHRQGDRG